jgi:hypothetical protein
MGVLFCLSEKAGPHALLNPTLPPWIARSLATLSQDSTYNLARVAGADFEGPKH